MKIKSEWLVIVRNQLGTLSLICLSFFWLGLGLVFSQPTATTAKSTSRTETPSSGSGAAAGALVALDEDYRIGINDVIEIQIEDAQELSGSFRIAKSGGFLMPFLGRLTAHNKTPEELSKEIADGLRNRYLSEPNVKVVVKQYNSRSFFIQGAVRSPGVYQIEDRPSLLVLLTLAGGLADNHSSTGFILRPNKQDQQADDDPKAEGKGPTSKDAKDAKDSEDSQSNIAKNEYSLLKVNINGLFQGRFDQNMYLEPGDIVNIPQSELFFVAGEVAAPGSFPLREGTTLRQAISLAQGTNFKADLGRGVIFREDLGTGKKKEVKVDIAAVMKGKDEDIMIYPNDIIVVPNSRMKSITAPLLSALGMNAVRVPVF